MCVLSCLSTHGVPIVSSGGRHRRASREKQTETETDKASARCGWDKKPRLIQALFSPFLGGCELLLLLLFLSLVEQSGAHRIVRHGRYLRVVY